MWINVKIMCCLHVLPVAHIEHDNIPNQPCRVSCHASFKLQKAGSLSEITLWAGVITTWSYFVWIKSHRQHNITTHSSNKMVAFFRNNRVKLWMDIRGGRWQEAWVLLWKPLDVLPWQQPTWQREEERNEVANTNQANGRRTKFFKAVFSSVMVLDDLCDAVFKQIKCFIH